MTSGLIYCPKCKRYVPFTRKRNRIYCAECGTEISPGKKKKNE